MILAFATVKTGDFHPCVSQKVTDIVDINFGIYENNHGSHREPLQNLFQFGFAIPVVDKFNTLLNIGFIRFGNYYLDECRKTQVFSCKLFHIWLHSSTEHVENFIVAMA